MKKKTGRPSQYDGIKLGKIMKDFDVSCTKALHIHIQDKNYREAQRVKESKAK